MMKAIFVGGCDRSGTTLLGSLLGAYDGAICTPESQFLTPLLRQTEVSQGKCDRELVGLVKGQWRFKLWGLPELGNVTGADGGIYSFVEQIVATYGGMAGTNKQIVWVDHTPENMRRALLLEQTFEDAKYIHLVRDARGVIASVLPLDWGPNSVIEGAHWWLERVAYGLAVENMLGPDRVIRLRFEDLVLDQESSMERLRAFLGLERRDRHAQVEQRFVPPKYTQGQHELIGESVQSSAATKWKKALSPWQVGAIEEIAGDMIRMLGYELEQYRGEPLITRSDRYREALGGLIGHYRNSFRNRIRRSKALLAKH